MTRKILLPAVIAAIVFGSCTTSYKTGQTPDDVYYSPERPREEYVRTEQRQEDNRYRYDNYDAYEDRYLRMRVRDRYRWSDLDDWYVFNNRYNYYSYNTGSYWNNPWSPASYWNNYYNPYCQPTYYYPKSGGNYNYNTVVNNKPRTFNLNTYNNSGVVNSNGGNPKSPRTSSGSYNNNYNNESSRSSNSDRSNSGNVLRNIFSGGNAVSLPIRTTAAVHKERVHLLQAAARLQVRAAAQEVHR
jgi:hypothetical protein